MTSGRGLGWVKPPTRTAELVAKHVAHIGAALGTAYPDRSTSPWAPWIQDQADEESCTCRVGAAHIWALKGIKCDVYVPWWDGRLYDAPGQPLRNVGLSTDGLLHALGKHGAAPVGGFRATGPDYAETPPAFARLDAVARELDIVPVYASGQDAIDAMAVGLSGADGNGQRPGTIVVRVDHAVEFPDPGGFVGPESGPNRGQHALTLDGDYITKDGALWLRAWGSWGAGYGAGGLIYLHESRVAGSPFLSLTRGCT